MRDISNVRRVACIALVMGFAHAVPAADILIADAKSQPESLSTPLPKGRGHFSSECSRMPQATRYGRAN